MKRKKLAEVVAEAVAEMTKHAHAIETNCLRVERQARKLRTRIRQQGVNAFGARTDANLIGADARELADAAHALHSLQKCLGVAS